jgi:two-component system CheB/CheR fusion protein
VKLPSRKSARVLRILLVEDNLDQLHTLAGVLRGMGHTVDYAINGYVAMDIARRLKPDYVLLDLGLPGMSGFEVAKQLRADPELSQVPVIATTAYSDGEFRDRAKEVGIDDYLVKPIEVSKWYELFGGARCLD